MTQHDAAGPPAAPTVFVSFAHDDKAHVDAVLAFANLLAACGVQVEFDLWRTDRRHDWYAWALHHIRNSEFVIVVASPMYRLVGDGTAPSDLHRGVQAEAAALREHLYGDRATWLGRILPVVLPGRAIGELPDFVQANTASHYVLESVTATAAEELLRVLTRQPRYVRPAPGSVPVLPPEPAPGARDLEWRPLAEPVAVRWRADLLDSRGTEPPRTTLELHLVPTAVPSRIPVGRLEAIGDQLGELGRSRGYFPPDTEVRTGSSSEEAGAFIAGRDHWYGLAVHRDGQRSAWGPLPTTVVGSVFDRADVAERLTAMLDILLDITLNPPAGVVPVVGLDPTGILRKGPVNDLDGMPVIPHALPKLVRLRPDEHVGFNALCASREQAAHELTVRLAIALGFS